jgi:hypothetical protein
VKGIKILGLAAVAALALTAFSGVASAAGGAFVAGSYPATVTGAATGEQGKLTTARGQTFCTSPTIAANLAQAGETLSATGEYAQPTCGFNTSLKLNGCEFIFHAPVEGTSGSFDIGGSKCTGITGTQAGTGIVIPPQTGLAATFENEGSGTGAKVKVQAQVAGNLKYELTSGEFKGSYSNGSYTTAWSLTGKAGGVATGVSTQAAPGFSVTGAGGGSQFHSELYPATIGGEQVEGKVGEKTYSKVELFIPEMGSVRCNTFTLAGSSLLEDTSELQLAPTMASCSITGVPKTVTQSPGCSFNFTLTGGLPYVGSLFLCETKVALNATCTVTFVGQTRPGMEYVNTGAGTKAAVEAKAGLTGLEYVVSKGAGTCPGGVPNGTYTNGKFTGVMKLSVAKVG